MGADALVMARGRDGSTDWGLSSSPPATKGEFISLQCLPGAVRDTSPGRCIPGVKMQSKRDASAHGLPRCYPPGAGCHRESQLSSQWLLTPSRQRAEGRLEVRGVSNRRTDWPEGIREKAAGRADDAVGSLGLVIPISILYKRRGCCWVWQTATPKPGCRSTGMENTQC